MASEYLKQKAEEARARKAEAARAGSIPVLSSQHFTNVPLRNAQPLTKATTAPLNKPTARPAINVEARDIAVRKAFAARQDKSVPTPVMPKIAEPVKTYTPAYAGRLSGGGMNLTGDTYEAVMDKREDDGRRLKAGAATLGYSTLGMIPNFVETTDQALKNAADNNRFIGKNEAYKVAAKEARGVNAYAHGRLNTELGTVTKAQQEFETLYKKADSVKTKTAVDQNKTGQLLMSKARESHEIATEGMGGVEKLIADTALSMYQNAPGIALTAITKAPVAGLSLMGLQAASAKTAELNARGLAPNEALVRGATTGAIESVTEKLPLDNLLDIAKGKAGQNFLKNVFKQAGIEGAEEGVAYTANYVADAMANDPEAQFSLADLGLAMAAGALSGGVFGVGGSMIGSKSDKVSDPVTEAMSTSQDAATRTTAEVQKANPDTVVVTPDAEALMAQGVKPTTAVDITKNVTAVTEGAAGITSKQIESILKDPKAGVLFEQKSGIKLSSSKAEARVQIKEFYAQTVEVKAAERVMPVSVVGTIADTNFVANTQEHTVLDGRGAESSTAALKEWVRDKTNIYDEGEPGIFDVRFQDRNITIQRKSDGSIISYVSGAKTTEGLFSSNAAEQGGFSSFSDALEWGAKYLLTKDASFQKNNPKTTAELTGSKLAGKPEANQKLPESITAEEQTFDPTIPMEVDGQIVDMPIEEVRRQLTQSGATPEVAEARLHAYDSYVQKLGHAPRFAPFTAENKNTAVEAFAQDNAEVLKELGLSGIEVYYAPPRNDPQTGLRIREEGLFDRSRNVVRLNGAVLNGQDAAAAVVIHELLHKAATKDEAIADRIIASFEQSKGIKLDNRYKKYALKYNGFVPGVDASAMNRMTPAEVAKLLTDEQKAYLREEIASDLMKEVLGTKKKMEQFAKSGGKSVLEQVRVIIDRILSALGNKNATLRVAYNNMLRDLDAVLRSAELESDSKSKVAGEFTEEIGTPRYSLEVTDKETLDSLNNALKDDDVYYNYKSMSFWGYDEDGNAVLRSPMAEIVDGNLTDSYLLPQKSKQVKWYQAAEDESQLLVKYRKEGNKADSYVLASDMPDLVAADWSNLYFKLTRKNVDTGEAETIYARYNPYEHSSNLTMNDQFKGAYKRPNLVTVKMAVPKSEEGAYRAKFAKDGTGWSDWKSGDVVSKINKQKKLDRMVYLSRYAAPVEIVPDSEVAQMYKEYLSGTDVKVPDNVVSPSLLAELRKAGVPIEVSGKVEKYAEALTNKKVAKKSDIRYSLETQEVEGDSKSGVRASVEATEVDSEGNKLTPEQQEFFKDSKVRDENGRLKVVYHHSSNRFTVFNRDYARTGMDIDGFFFAPENDPYNEYGDKVIKAYLNITNPAINPKWEYGVTYDAGTKERLKLISEGYDGVIGVEDGEVFEYMVFDSNQVKSVDNKNPTDDPDIRYSLETQEVKKLEQKTAELQFELKASERQTKNLQEKNVKLKDEMKLTTDRQGIRVDRNSVKRVATKLLRENKSSYDAEELQDRLSEFYSDIQTNSIDWGETDLIAYNIAQDILRYSTQKFEPLPEYNGVREYLRKTKLHVPEDLHGELESEGGYNYFRKSNMGHMKLSSKDGKPVDEAYNELSNDYPGLFDEKKYSNPGDQLIHMAEELNKLQPGDYTSSFIDTKGELLGLAAQITDGITEVLTNKPTQADKIASKVRSEYEALPFNVWLEDQLANNKTNAVYDIIRQKSSSLLNSDGGKPVYFTTKQARSLTRFLETVQADLTGLQEEVVAVKVESTKKVERVRKEAKVDANWTAAQNKKRTDWLEAKAVHEVEVKAEAAKERLAARMDKINAENEAKVERIKAADAKRYAKVEKQLEHQKRKRRLASVKGADVAKTMRKYQTEKNKQKAVEDKGTRFIANISKVPEPKTFGEKVDAAKQAVKDGANTARFIVENNLQEFDNFSSWEEVPMTSALVKRAQNMPSMAYNILTSEYMTPDGEFGGTSLSEVIHIKGAKGKIDREAQDIYNEYLYVMHTADRMAFIERAREKVLAFEAAHPEIAALDSEGLADVITARERSDETKANKALAEEYTKLLKELNAAQDKPVVAWESEDQPGVRVSMTAEEARERAAALRADNPWLVERSEALYAWWDRFVRDWAVGVQITEAEYEQMREIYPHYVPTFRVQEKQGKAGGSTAGGGVSTASVFKPAKGSTKDLKRADDNFVTQLQKICNQRGMSDLCTWMMDQAYSQPDVFGDRMLVADPTGEDAVDVSADLDDRSSAADAMLTVDKDGMYKLTTWRDGEKIEAYVSKNMYRGFQALTKANRVAWVETGVKWGRWVTGWSKMAITGYSPSFMVRNPIMDFPTAVVNSTVGTKFPMYYFKAVNAIRTNSEEWRRFKAMGGTQSNFYNQEKGFEDNSRLAVKKGPLHWVSKANENTEGVTRFAEYLATTEKYGDTQEGRALGLKNAAEITVDFNRTGELGRILNAWIPYHNPAVQGISRQLRLVFGGQQKSIQKRAANLGIVLTRASMVALLPEIVLQALYAALGEDDEWRKLTAWERGSNYSIPRHWFTGDPADKGLFVKIPKSREWSRYIGTPFMMMTDAFAGKEDAFEGYFEQVLKPSVSPPMIPILVQQAVDLAKNKTYTNADIVPNAYQGLEEVEGGKQEQWNDKTSNLAIFIGGMIDFSPMQIDYLAGSLFGNWGKFATQMTGNPGLAASDSTVAEGLWYNFNNNFTRRFVSDNVYSNATTSKFYDTYTEVEGAWKLEKLRGKDPDNSMIKQTSNVMSGYFDRISDINAEIRALNLTPMPKKDRDEKNRVLRQSINAIAAEAMSKYEDIQSGKSKNPKLETQYEDLGITAPVSKELIKLKDVEGYNYQPVKVGKSFADPRLSGYEYKLTEEQRAEYNIIYMELYNQTMATAISKASYQNADNEGKAAKLATARDGVGSRPSLTDQARSEFLKRNKDLKTTKK